LVLNFNISETPLSLDIYPVQDIYYTGEVVSFISNQNDTYFLVNDEVVSSPYAFSKEGNITIKAVKEGYVSANLTIEVKRAVSINGCSPLQKNWKKGSNVICELTENSSWEVSNSGLTVAVGESNQVKFKINKVGFWQIKSNGRSLAIQNIEKKEWFGWFSFETIKKHWIIVVIILLTALTLGYYFFIYRNQGSSTENVGFEMSPKE